MKRAAIMILSLSILAACGQQTTNDNGNTKEESLERHEGVIAWKNGEERVKEVLLIPDITEKDIEQTSTERALIELARDNSGAYYSVTDKKFVQLNIGDAAVIYWNGNQSASDPPQRRAAKIEIFKTLQD